MRSEEREHALFQHIREQRRYGYAFPFSWLPTAVPEFNLGPSPRRLLEVGSALWSPVACPAQEGRPCGVIDPWRCRHFSWSLPLPSGCIPPGTLPESRGVEVPEGPCRPGGPCPPSQALGPGLLPREAALPSRVVLLSRAAGPARAGAASPPARLGKGQSPAALRGAAGVRVCGASVGWHGREGSGRGAACAGRPGTLRCGGAWRKP